MKAIGGLIGIILVLACGFKILAIVFGWMPAFDGAPALGGGLFLGLWLCSKADM